MKFIHVIAADGKSISININYIIQVEEGPSVQLEKSYSESSFIITTVGRVLVFQNYNDILKLIRDAPTL